MKRTIIKIDENLCNGCGTCVKGCHEGALQIIDGKAHIVDDMYCDGLGACIGDCPEGAITLEEREAEAYNEQKVMKRMAPLQERPCGCPESREMSFNAEPCEANVNVSSQLHQCPIQLHFVKHRRSFSEKCKYGIGSRLYDIYLW